MDSKGKRGKPSKSSKGQTSLHFGTVSAVDAALARARVRLPDMGNMESYWLPVLHQCSKANQSYWLPDTGDTVTCLLDERGEQGVILGAVYNGSNRPPKESQEIYHVQFEDGSSFTFNRSESILRVRITGRIEIQLDEDLTIIAPQGVHITNEVESSINSKAIAVIGATDNDSESNGPDQLVSSGQL